MLILRKYLSLLRRGLGERYLKFLGVGGKKQCRWGNVRIRLERSLCWSILGVDLCKVLLGSKVMFGRGLGPPVLSKTD